MSKYEYRLLINRLNEICESLKSRYDLTSEVVRLVRPICLSMVIEQGLTDKETVDTIAARYGLK